MRSQELDRDPVPDARELCLETRSSGRNRLVKFLGWLLMALATSLGAQFWFNLLSEALKLRATGRKPPNGEGEKDEQPERGAPTSRDSDKNSTP
jgi:hypothetical protein